MPMPVRSEGAASSTFSLVCANSNSKPTTSRPTPNAKPLAGRLAATADDALRAIANDNLDVLLTDIAMPEQDGYSLLERLRRSVPELPAIAVTACVSAEDRRRAREAGFRAHVAKPIDPQELLAAVVAVRRQVA